MTSIVFPRFFHKHEIEGALRELFGKIFQALYWCLNFIMKKPQLFFTKTGKIVRMIGFNFSLFLDISYAFLFILI